MKFRSKDINGWFDTMGNSGNTYDTALPPQITFQHAKMRWTKPVDREGLVKANGKTITLKANEKQTSSVNLPATSSLYGIDHD